MKNESEMKTRKERSMADERAGAANRQANRSRSAAARGRKPSHSIPAWEGDEEWGAGKTIASVVIGTAFMYAFMWLAAAF